MGLRITTLIFGFTFLYSALVWNIFNIQIGHGEYYSAKASSIFNSSGVLSPTRGNIYFTDKNGGSISMAINRESPVIFADTRHVDDVPEAVEKIAGIVDISKEELSKLLSRKNDAYVPLVRKATASQVEYLKNEPVFGINVGYEPLRYYPFDKAAAHLLGYVSIDRSSSDGVYGVELGHNKSLKGISGNVSADGFRPPQNGKDLYLTIDRNIQSQAEEIMKRLIDNFHAEGGTVMVNNPKTGQLLAMASFPTFDPNDYGKYSIADFLNPAAQAVYEPGSVFKVITMAAGIDAGKITPDTTFYDTGFFVLNGRTVKNWDLKAHGTMTMTNVIEKSLNTGAAYAEKMTGHKTFYDYLVKFGFKDITGADLPGEVRGSLGNLEKNARDINFATASFGQGISVTPLQLLQAMSAIANHGVMMKPYVDGSLEPEEIRRVITDETSQKVVDMMVSAVDKAEIAKVNGYTVAGKTGTAQVPDLKVGGYTHDVINTYVGFAPAHDPAFVILIKLNKPPGAPLAGLTVVPAFQELAQFILNYYNIPPDNIKGQH